MSALNWEIPEDLGGEPGEWKAGLGDRADPSRAQFHEVDSPKQPFPPGEPIAVIERRAVIPLGGWQPKACVTLSTSK